MDDIYKRSLAGDITKEEAIENAKEAIRGYITALEEDNLIVPEDKFDALLGAV